MFCTWIELTAAANFSFANTNLANKISPAAQETFCAFLASRTWKQTAVGIGAFREVQISSRRRRRSTTTIRAAGQPASVCVSNDHYFCRHFRFCLCTAPLAHLSFLSGPILCSLCAKLRSTGPFVFSVNRICCAQSSILILGDDF